MSQLLRHASLAKRCLGWSFAFYGLTLIAWGGEASAQDSITAEQAKFFESKIRPVLVEKCYACHSETAKEIHGGLLLDTRAGIRQGGDSGPAVVPGDLKKSLLIAAIRYLDRDLAMPPQDAGGKLPDSAIRDFETWVTMGAADPREGASRSVAKYDTSAAKSWWSFQPLKLVEVPQLQSDTPGSTWAESDIDRFLAAKWNASGVNPAADAEPLVLLRRLRFDLTGLPPTVDEVSSFLADWNQATSKRELLERTVDRLLRSPQFGERWGRHWLDVARYAESSGKDVNVVFPQAWRYRDYVIDSFNKDKPYDQFLREQIAGDLLPSRNDAQRAEQLIATGFLAIGAKSLNETKPKQFAVDLADEQIDAITQSFLGLTVSCARCHDHKFDPISQLDYTALAGILLSTETKFGTPGGVQGRNQSTLVELPVGARLPVVARGMTAAERQQKQTRLDRLRQQQRDALAQRAGGKKATDGMTNFDVVRIITQATQVEAELSVVNEDGSAKPLAMGVVERTVTALQQRGPGATRRPMGRVTETGFEQIGDSPLFARGNIENVGDTVPRGVPAIVAPNAQSIAKTASGRLELANALASPTNPLTSRVIVNRVWHWLFGRGLVASVDNFGTTGSTPSHPELLDHLATQFTREGWSVKELIRAIVLSHAYRLSATHDEHNFAADPDNTLVWRHSPRRLEAEEIRDAILAASGRLDLKPPVASLIGRSGEGPIGGERLMALNEEQIGRANHDGRSIYLPIARNVQPDLLAAFDLPDAAAPDGARESTNVPSQALFLLNSDFVAEHAKSLAEMVLKSHPGVRATDRVDERLSLAFQRVLNRKPLTSERAAAKQLLERHDKDALAAWTSVARSLFATAELRILD